MARMVVASKIFFIGDAPCLRSILKTANYAAIHSVESRDWLSPADINHR
jgi:hypothetical protein